MGETWAAINPKTTDGQYRRFINLDWHPKRPEWALAAVIVDFNSAAEVHLFMIIDFL